ncbi:MAG: SOS response-associated peptidase [Opitutaceae bacterium]|nr:SOS response-associated peptidase [Opitutaceae bacterium]
MCTRYHLSREHYREILAALGIAAPDDFDTRYNIAPMSRIPTVRAGPKGPEAVLCRWGLVPAWARSADGAPLLNARAETAATKPAFRGALRHRRCVVPASGYYEWQAIGRARRPWFFRRRDGAPFGFAGLWETWRDPAGTILESCAIITIEPNDLARPIHDRMPVMLVAEQFTPWLDPGLTEPASLAPILRPPDDAAMTALAVGPHVSNVRHEGPECLAPAPPGTDESQLSLGIG